VHQTTDPEVVFITARSKAETTAGKQYANEYCIYMRVKRGLVTEHTEYFNPLPVMAAFM
jgi:ketosteroid isomerase-like protein